MADIALVPSALGTTPEKINIIESRFQHTAQAGEDLTAGNPVRIDPATGRWRKTDTTAAGNADAYGIAVRTCKAGEAVTAVRKGVLDGFVLDALGYNARVFVSRNPGAVADSADATAGATNTTLGRVIPVLSQLRGANPDKALFVDL